MKNKINKVAIFGMGKSGKSALALAKKNGHEVFAINRGPVENWYQAEGINQLIDQCACHSEESFAQHFHKMDQIIISPGIPVSHPALKKAVDKGVPLLSEVEYAWQHTQDIPVIAITGSNGKTTTTTMISEALQMAGKKVFCGGNIGTPYCDLPLSEEKVDIAVIEVSSFQLETIHEFHPVISLILNISPNHTERYDRTEDYAAAKFHLLKNMTSDDDLILGTENPFLDQIKSHPVKKHFFSKGELPAGFKTFDFSQSKVRGEHNEANFYAAYKTLELLGIPGLDKMFQTFINSFAGVPHRLEHVLQSNGLNIYNDAKSTNTLATLTAIRAFEGKEPLHLILGGKLRNDSDRILPDLLPYKKRITTIFTIGDVTERLHDELKGEFQVLRAYELKKVLELVQERKLQGNLVFSPGFPSFDQFKNYVDRGETFKKLVKECF